MTCHQSVPFLRYLCTNQIRYPETLAEDTRVVLIRPSAFKGSDFLDAMRLDLRRCPSRIVSPNADFVQGTRKRELVRSLLAISSGLNQICQPCLPHRYMVFWCLTLPLSQAARCHPSVRRNHLFTQPMRSLSDSNDVCFFTPPWEDS